MKRNVASLTVTTCALLSFCLSAVAQRDPTRSPEFESAAGGAPGVKVKSGPALGDLGLTLLVRDGTPYLASATRLYAQGQTVGSYTIERIAETEVWLRNGKELHKIPRFNGIERRAAATERPTP